MIKSIHYWDHIKTIYVELEPANGSDVDIKISRGKIDMEIEGDYYGPAGYYLFFDIYDLCCLIALWTECYGGDDDPGHNF